MNNQLHKDSNFINALLALNCVFVFSVLILPLIEVNPTIQRIHEWIEFFYLPIIFFLAGTISAQNKKNSNQGSFVLGLIVLFFSYQYLNSLVNSHLKQEMHFSLFWQDRISLILLGIILCQLWLPLINALKFPIVVSLCALLFIGSFDVVGFYFFYYASFFIAGFHLKEIVAVWKPTKIKKTIALSGLIASMAFWPFLQLKDPYQVLLNGLTGDQPAFFGVGFSIFMFIINVALTLSFFAVICGYKNWYSYSYKNLLVTPLAICLLISLCGEYIQTMYPIDFLNLVFLLGFIYLTFTLVLFTPLTNIVPWLADWSQSVVLRKSEKIEEASLLQYLALIFGKLKHYFTSFMAITYVSIAIRILTPVVFSIFLIFIVIETPRRNGFAELFSWVISSKYVSSISVLFSVLLFLTLRGAFSKVASYIILAFLTASIAALNLIKLKYWGIPLLPNDFHLIPQAYDSARFMLGAWTDILLVSALIVASTSLLLVIKRNHALLNNNKRILFGSLVTGSLLILLYVNPALLIRNSLMPAIWQVSNVNNQYEVSGFIPAFIYNFLTSHVTQINYDKSSIEKIIASLPKENFPEKSAEDKINVVIIQSEAFWDPANLTPGLFPGGSPGNLDSVCREMVSGACQAGYIDVPVFGGGTANTEFEFLTGITTNLFPAGAIPYIQYVHKPTPSIVWRFKEAGYNTIALHPFLENFWNRKDVYPRLGFDKFFALNDFEEADRNALYVSDKALTSKVINVLNSSNEPAFLFAVSMANHGPFADKRYGNLPPVEMNWDAFGKKLNKQDKEILLTYSIGIRESIASLKELLNELSKENTIPTVVVFYGDHLPILGTDYRIYKKGNFVTSDQDLSDRKLFSTPYLVWSNKSPLKSHWPNRIPVSLLGQKVTQEASLGKTYFFNALEKTYLDPLFYKAGSIGSEELLITEEQKQYKELYKQISLNILFGNQESNAMYGLNKH